MFVKLVHTLFNGIELQRVKYTQKSRVFELKLRRKVRQQQEHIFKLTEEGTL